jgi:hypothetical protein
VRGGGPDRSGQRPSAKASLPRHRGATWQLKSHVEVAHPTPSAQADGKLVAAGKPRSVPAPTTTALARYLQCNDAWFSTNHIIAP